MHDDKPLSDLLAEARKQKNPGECWAEEFRRSADARGISFLDAIESNPRVFVKTRLQEILQREFNFTIGYSVIGRHVNGVCSCPKRSPKTPTP